MMLDYFDFGRQENTLMTIIRVFATVVGGIVGWFLCDPVTRLTYRLSFKGATPGAMLFLSKTTGGAALAATVWFFLPLGWGPGLGLGMGGGPGKGPGPGGGTSLKDPKSTDDKKEINPKIAPPVESIEIEIIDDKRYKNDDRFFLVRRVEPALSRDELEDYLKKNHKKIEVTPVLTKSSIRGTINPLGDLSVLTKQYDIKTLVTKIP